MATTKQNQTSTIKDVFTERKMHKEGNNPCICTEANVAENEPGVWAFTTETCKDHTRRAFAQGHDARHKGNLIRAHRAGVNVKITNATTGVTVTATPLEWAALREWERFLTEGKENAKALARLNGTELPA